MGSKRNTKVSIRACIIMDILVLQESGIKLKHTIFYMMQVQQNFRRVQVGASFAKPKSNSKNEKL